jgi:UDP-N-acetyl-D-glucosamine dehydrogenase
VGKDFFLAYSPERIDPGNRVNHTRNIPKVIGGITERCAELGMLFYHQFIETMVPVSSTESAEMVKLLENTFRSVNIALVNEMAMMCHKFNIDVWEVIDAAKTKPFGYMPFNPGPGLCGHCLPVDPYYLTWKARINGFQPQLIEIASLINSQMPHFTVSRVLDALNERQRSLKGSKILAVGVSYKRDTNDVRESPALEVMDGLRRKGAHVFYTDPFIPSIKLDGQMYTSVRCDAETLRSMDCAVILTDHSIFDYALIVANSAVIVDSRNALKDYPHTNVMSL